MAQVTGKKQLDIYEIATDDGGVGLQFGDGPVLMGYDGADLMRLLEHIFPGMGDELDGDLYDLAQHYLNGEVE